MPEKDEPTEKEEQERFEKCVGNKKHRTKKYRFREPRQLVSFIMSHDSAYVWVTGARLKKIFPDLSMSAKKIDEMMATKEFKEERDRQIPKANKEQAMGRFYTILDRYYEGQLQLKRGKVKIPDAKAVTIFGQYSGEFNPMLKTELYDGHIMMDEERQKQAISLAVDATLNKIKRQQKEKREKEGKE